MGLGHPVEKKTSSEKKSQNYNKTTAYRLILFIPRNYAYAATTVSQSPKRHFTATRELFVRVIFVILDYFTHRLTLYHLWVWNKVCAH